MKKKSFKQIKKIINTYRRSLEWQSFGTVSRFPTTLLRDAVEGGTAYKRHNIKYINK